MGMFSDQLDDVPNVLAKAIAEDPSLTAALEDLKKVVEKLDGVEKTVGKTHEAMHNVQAKVDDIREQLRKRRGVSFANSQEEAFLHQKLQEFRNLPPRIKKPPTEPYWRIASEKPASEKQAQQHQEAARSAERESNPSLAAAEHFKAYRAACEKELWRAALQSLRQAIRLDAKWTPFDLHKFEILEILGAGGFGTVFRCRDRYLNKEVAVKVLHTAGTRATSTRSSTRRQSPTI